MSELWMVFAKTALALPGPLATGEYGLNRRRSKSLKKETTWGEIGWLLIFVVILFGAILLDRWLELSGQTPEVAWGTASMVLGASIFVMRGRIGWDRSSRLVGGLIVFGGGMLLLSGLVP